MSDLLARLRKRAEIRRQIATRKSVQEGKPDRISDLLEEAANELEKLMRSRDATLRSDLVLPLEGDKRREGHSALLFVGGKLVKFDPNPS